MTKLDWSRVSPRKEPTRRQISLYKRWVQYLKDSRLDEQTIRERARQLAEEGKEVPKS